MKFQPENFTRSQNVKQYLILRNFHYENDILNVCLDFTWNHIEIGMN